MPQLLSSAMRPVLTGSFLEMLCVRTTFANTMATINIIKTRFYISDILFKVDFTVKSKLSVHNRQIRLISTAATCRSIMQSPKEKLNLHLLPQMERCEALCSDPYKYFKFTSSTCQTRLQVCSHVSAATLITQQEAKHG